jgi:hypothetical protein
MISQNRRTVALQLLILQDDAPAPLPGPGQEPGESSRVESSRVEPTQDAQKLMSQIRGLFFIFWDQRDGRSACCAWSCRADQVQLPGLGLQPWMNGSMAEAVVRLKRCTRPGARHEAYPAPDLRPGPPGPQGWVSRREVCLGLGRAQRVH